MLFLKKIKHKKYNCPVKIRLVPYGGGWTDVHMDIGEDNLYFVISSYQGNQFEDLVKALYHMYPKQSDSENADSLIDYVEWLTEYTGEEYVPVKIAETREVGGVYVDIPWKAQFTWDGEGPLAKWYIERNPDNKKDFMLDIKIVEEDYWEDRPEITHQYCVRYKDMCYAVAKACTEALKKHGIYGYHHATYYNDINIRHLLFLKAVALDNFEARKLKFYEEKGKGETSDFEKEMRLLLMDM